MTDTSILTPREALEMLLPGNQRFVAGAPQHPNQDSARRAEIAPVQHPFAMLFGCSDSRLAAEIIFDRGLGDGDLLVVRNAGHVLGAGGTGQQRVRGERVLDCPLVVLRHDAYVAVAATHAALEEG
jgi:carbonic anhydrase